MYLLSNITHVETEDEVRLMQSTLLDTKGEKHFPPFHHSIRLPVHILQLTIRESIEKEKNPRCLE